MASTLVSNPIDKRKFQYLRSIADGDGSEIWGHAHYWKRKSSAEEWILKQKQHKRITYKLNQSIVSNEYFVTATVKGN